MTSDYPLDEDGNYSQMLAKKSTAGENNLDSDVIRRIYGLPEQTKRPKDSTDNTAEIYAVKYVRRSTSPIYGNKVHTVIKREVSPEGLESILNAIERNRSTKLLNYFIIL